MKVLILLNSDSNATVFCNPEYVNKIWDTTECIKIDTNVEVLLESYQKYDVPHLSAHIFNKESITSTVALSNATNKNEVTMCTEIEKETKVYFPNKIVKCCQLGNRLWGLDTSDESSCISFKESKTNKVSENRKAQKLKIYKN